MSRRKDRRCESCGESISGRGGRAIRCEPCQTTVDQARDAERHASNRERVSTLRRLRRQGLSEPDPDERQPERVVDYSEGGSARPEPLGPGVMRNNPRHDAVTRARLDHRATMADMEPEQSSWEQQLQARQAGPPSVAFPPTLGAEPGFRGREQGELINAAADGSLYRAASGRRAVQAQVTKRFGDRVREPIQIQAAHLASPPPNMVQAEQVQAQQVWSASEHLRRLGPSRRR